MVPRELFGIGVRLFGIWLICRGLPFVASFVDLKLFPDSDKARDSAPAHLIYAMLDFGFAGIFLLWTNTLVAWSYGISGKTNEAGIDADSEPSSLETSSANTSLLPGVSDHASLGK